MSENVFVCTPEIYCALRGVASIAHKLCEAMKSKPVKPKNNPVAINLGLQEAPKTLSAEELFSLVTDYVIGNVDTPRFEEVVMDNLGVAGTALVGISGAVQNVEAMIETIEESKVSAELMERTIHREQVQESNISELLLKGVALVKITIKDQGDMFVATAQKLPHPQCTSTEWIEYVRNYSVEASEGKPPYLQRSVKPEKRPMVTAYGLESFFTEYKFALKHLPGTEDFVAKKRRMA